MRPFLITVAAGLAVIVGTNFYADPARRMLRRAAPVDRAWSSAQSLLVPDNFDDREFRAAHLRLIPRPDLLIFGSSRALEFNSEHFNPGLNVYNAWMALSTVEDYIAVWQTLKELGKTPSRVLIVCDSWVFNENAPYFRWKSNARLYETFRADASGRRFARVWAWLWTLRDTLDLRGTEAAEYFSLELFKSSLKELRAGPRNAEFQLAASTAPLADRMSWRADGAGTYSVRQLEPKRLTRVVALEGSLVGLGNYKYSAGKAAEFAALVNDMQARGTKVFVLIPPYQSVVLEEAAARSSLRDALPEHRRTLLDLSTRLGFELCDALDPARVGCADDEFLDGMHMRASCLKKTLAHCVGSWKTWSQGLTPPPGAR